MDNQIKPSISGRRQFLIILFMILYAAVFVALGIYAKYLYYDYFIGFALAGALGGGPIGFLSFLPFIIWLLLVVFGGTRFSKATHRYFPKLRGFPTAIFFITVITGTYLITSPNDPQFAKERERMEKELAECTQFFSNAFTINQVEESHVKGDKFIKLRVSANFAMPLNIAFISGRPDFATLKNIADVQLIGTVQGMKYFDAGNQQFELALDLSYYISSLVKKPEEITVSPKEAERFKTAEDLSNYRIKRSQELLGTTKVGPILLDPLDFVVENTSLCGSPQTPSIHMTPRGPYTTRQYTLSDFYP